MGIPAWREAETRAVQQQTLERENWDFVQHAVDLPGLGVGGGKNPTTTKLCSTRSQLCRRLERDGTSLHYMNEPLPKITFEDSERCLGSGKAD